MDPGHCALGLPKAPCVPVWSLHWGQHGSPAQVSCLVGGFFMETNRDHSVVFEIASKYCILDCFVDHDGYSISSEGFLPTVVDLMVI